MSPQPTYLSILDVAFGWHGIPVPNMCRNTFPPVVRITLAMLLRAIVDSRLAVYEPSTRGLPTSERRRNSRICMEEMESTPAVLAELHASGRYDRTVLASYRLSMDELFVWATGEDLAPPAICNPSWAPVDRQARVGRPGRPKPQDRGEALLPRLRETPLDSR